MSESLIVRHNLIIPAHEFEISTSRSSGPGGQHVNKTDSRITIHWNIKASGALSEEQKERLLNNIRSHITADGDLVVSSSTSRSQLQNKNNAFELIANIIRAALHVPKKRKETKTPKSIKEARIKSKKLRSLTKKMRSERF